MPSLKDIRRRIGSVKNTQKITKAMKMVAAAKLRRSQENIIATRPYAKYLREVIGELATRANPEDHPLMAQRETERALLVVFTSDRGLCGGFNTNVLRVVDQYRNREGNSLASLELDIIGRKGRDYYNYRRVKLNQTMGGVDSQIAFERSRDLSKAIIHRFEAQEVDKVVLVYNEFKSAMTQRVAFEQLLPIVPKDLSNYQAQGQSVGDFLYEPDKKTVLEDILPLYVQVELYRASLESIASEFGARMTAMDKATTSAGDLISSLTLQYNKARQASITKELLEIVSGAEAL